MSTNAQKRRANKQASRRKASKEKAKTVRRQEHRMLNLLSNLSDEKADKIHHRTIYDVLNDGKEMNRRSQAGEGVQDMISSTDLLMGVDAMITLSVKLHSGIAALMKLVEEGSIVLKEGEQDVVNAYEKVLVEFTEDVAVVLTLSKLKKEPEDYPEIVINLTNTMDELMTVHREIVLNLVTGYSQQLETYAAEHKPKDIPMYDYMSVIHEERLQSVIPLYETGHSKGLLHSILELSDEDLEIQDPIDDLENLAPVTIDNETGLDVSQLAPNDPVFPAAK